MSSLALLSLRRRIADFCRQKVATLLPPRDRARFETFALSLIDERKLTPRRGQGPDWDAISKTTGIDLESLRSARQGLAPGLDAIDRVVKVCPAIAPAPVAKRSEADAIRPPICPQTKVVPQSKNARSRPTPLRQAANDAWLEPDAFDEALDLHMRRNGETASSLLGAILGRGECFDVRTVNSWRQGRSSPRSVEALSLLPRIERRFDLPPGYFLALLPDPSRASTGHRAHGISRAEHRRLAWHLPDNFCQRPPREREEIVDWVRTVVIAGSTDYRRYQAAASKTPFGLRFTGVSKRQLRAGGDGETRVSSLRARAAPHKLDHEMQQLVSFKTATLTRLGYHRSGVWNPETASQKIEHLSLMFGALVARPNGPVRGAGVADDALTFALLIFPRVWDWYLEWRSQRRGFYTQWESEMLNVGVALTRKGTGWIRQSPELAERLRPILGLLSQDEIDTAVADWSGACQRFYEFGLARAKEVKRVSKVHRDPFEPILPILEAESPLGEYRKITDEILRLMPDGRRFPRAAAESARAYLMIRLGLHLGLRQKNLRQLLVCPRGGRPRSERALEDSKRGELRWSDRDEGWEVLVPAVAFKNSHSSFFGKKPYRLLLPDIGGLYAMIEDWIVRHRPVLLRDAADPHTFFVKTVKITSADAAYNQTTFYEAWRLTIQRYGIYNPYTGRGAIKGLLPHGPHNVRDVLATHILKQTGSYEQASYAIQDTPDTVAEHYGRFLPQDKAALAAQILNKVWLAA
jgi:hypothetical protein